jgi:hypothetical protein
MPEVYKGCGKFVKEKMTEAKFGAIIYLLIAMWTTGE